MQVCDDYLAHTQVTISHNLNKVVGTEHVQSLVLIAFMGDIGNLPTTVAIIDNLSKDPFQLVAQAWIEGAGRGLYTFGMQFKSILGYLIGK